MRLSRLRLGRWCRWLVMSRRRGGRWLRGRSYRGSLACYLRWYVTLLGWVLVGAIFADRPMTMRHARRTSVWRRCAVHLASRSAVGRRTRRRLFGRTRFWRDIGCRHTEVWRERLESTLEAKAPSGISGLIADQG